VASVTVPRISAVVSCAKAGEVSKLKIVRKKSDVLNR